MLLGLGRCHPSLSHAVNSSAKKLNKLRKCCQQLRQQQQQQQHYNKFAFQLRFFVVFFVVVSGISPCCLMHSQCAEFAANLWQFNENYLFRYTAAPPLQPPSTRRWRRRRKRRCCQAFSCLLIIKWVSLHIPSKVQLQRVGHSNREIHLCRFQNISCISPISLRVIDKTC